MDFEFEPEIDFLRNLPLSYYNSFEENIEAQIDAAEDHLERIKDLKSAKTRMDKMVNKGEVILYVYDPVFREESEANSLEIYGLIPKTFSDYIDGFKIWWEEKTLHNFKWMFRDLMINPILDVHCEGGKPLDILTVHADNGWFVKTDVLINVRKWLLKYYPNHDLDVRYFEGE